MKLILFPAALICINFASIAQLPHASIYVHGLYAAPLDGSSKLYFNEGIGGVAGFLVGEKTTRFNASIGYTSFIAKGDNTFGNETYVPIKVGIRQYIPLTMHFLFLQGNAGLGFVSNGHYNTNYSPFAFDIGGGVKIAGFEAALVWDNFSEKDPAGWSSWFTIQAGFNFGF
jgi:hypothetical protein